jgi:hypothetical protein
MHGKPYIDHHSCRTAPEDIVRRLREIDPSFELVYWGAGVWRLGRIWPFHAARVTKARRILAMEFARDTQQEGNVRMARLAAEGFRSTCDYHQNDPDDRIVQDARIRIYNLREARHRVFQERLSETMGDQRLAESQRVAKDAASSMAGDAWDYAYRKPVSVMKAERTPSTKAN